MNNLIFDIKEFALHDGGGMRTTVFLKGCPLRCQWCHNPEGQLFESEISKNPSKCVDCGLCRRECNHASCVGAGCCLAVCPNNALKRIGEYVPPAQLAQRLLKNKTFLVKGGVTFSGGEPLCHGDYILQVIEHLEGIPTAVETCGFVESKRFYEYCKHINDIFFDVKLINDDMHKKYTGVSNKLILDNLEMLLKERFVTVRTPLIPGVTDTDENLIGISEFLAPYKHNLQYQLIPYNKLTGAKYKNLGLEYTPDFDETLPLNKNTEPFLKNGINVRAY